MPKDFSFEVLKLLSQRIVSEPEKIPEGEILQKTSCMNSDDAENMGNLLFLKKIIGNKNPKFKKFIDEFLIPYFETMGLAKWNKGEITQLGFRAGLRYIEHELIEKEANDSEAPVTESVVDEATAFADSGSDKE